MVFCRVADFRAHASATRSPWKTQLSPSKDRASLAAPRSNCPSAEKHVRSRTPGTGGQRFNLPNTLRSCGPGPLCMRSTNCDTLTAFVGPFPRLIPIKNAAKSLAVRAVIFREDKLMRVKFHLAVAMLLTLACVPTRLLAQDNSSIDSDIQMLRADIRSDKTK